VRKVLAYTWIAVFVAALYVAWIFYSRHQRTAAAEAEIQKRKQEEAQRVNQLIFGSGEIQFTTFVAEPGMLHRGDTAELCYGVVNAVRVELTPAVEKAKPTYRHCVEIAPKTTTTYTIKATDAKGNSKSASLTVQVR
jgi:hypothetical protein